MPNDAKLGLLAGVAGVVLAAVLFADAPVPPAVRPVPPAAAALPATPAARATPPRSPPADPVPAATPDGVPVAGRRAEVEAVPISRPALDEDE